MFIGAFMIPAMVCGTAFFINFIAIYYHASRAIPFGTMVGPASCCGWFTLSVIRQNTTAAAPRSSCQTPLRTIASISQQLPAFCWCNILLLHSARLKPQASRYWNTVVDGGGRGRGVWGGVWTPNAFVMYCISVDSVPSPPSAIYSSAVPNIFPHAVRALWQDDKPHSTSRVQERQEFFLFFVLLTIKEIIPMGLCASFWKPLETHKTAN